MLTIILFVCLLLLMLIVGILAGRNASNKGYQIYNNKLPAKGFIASYVATFIGAGFFVAGTAYSYQYGKSFMWYAIGAFFGITIFGFYSYWLRNYSQGKNFFNLPDLFNERFGSFSAKLLAYIMILLLAGDLAIQLISGGKILEILGIAPYYIAVGITITVIAIYLLSSGFKAVIWTDFILAILIGIITIIISYVSYTKIIVSGISFDSMPIGNTIGFFLFGVFGPFSISTYYQRIFAAKNAKTARNSTWISGVVIIILVFLLLFVGYAAKTLLPGIDPDIAFISLLKHVGGLIMAIGALALWSALMSTADTLSFSGSQIITHNIIGAEMKKKYTQMSILIILLLGFLISIWYPNIVTVGMLFLGGGMIIAPIGFFQWFMKLKKEAVNTAMIAGVIALILYTTLVETSPTIVIITFGVSTISLMIVHYSDKIIKRVNS